MWLRSLAKPGGALASGFPALRLGSFSRYALASPHPRSAAGPGLTITSRSISLARPPSRTPRDTKAAFQKGNVEETIAQWEREADVAELNLITEKLGLDRKKYKDISQQLSEIITLRTKLHGNNHPDTLYANGILASVYRVVGKYKNATPLIKQCLSIAETMMLEPHPEFPRKDLLTLYASCAEEYARCLLQQKEGDAALAAVRQALSVVRQGDTADSAVHLTLLYRLQADCHFALNSYGNAKDALEASESAQESIEDGSHLRYYLLNHWVSDSYATLQNHLLRAKIHARLSEWQEAEEALQSAWRVAAATKGTNSIECCNAFTELLDFYAEMIPGRIAVTDYVRLLTRALAAARSTDSILRKTRGLDKGVAFPYLPMVQRGLRALIPFEEQRGLCVTLLYEQLRVQEKYPAIYLARQEDTFTTVMALAQLLRDEKQPQEALELIVKYKEEFARFKEKNPAYVVPLIEMQAQLVISTKVDSDALISGKAESGLVAKSEQMTEAAESLEYVANFYTKKKNFLAAVRSLHALAIVQSLQGDLNEADANCFRCIRMIDSSFTEYASRIEVNRKDLAVGQVGRFVDLLILRGSLLRNMQESGRAIEYFKAALQLLTVSRESLTDDASARVKDEISRAADMLRCLENMMEISQEQPEADATFLSSCQTHHDSALAELNRLHARLQKTQQRKQAASP